MCLRDTEAAGSGSLQTAFPMCTDTPDGRCVVTLHSELHLSRGLVCLTFGEKGRFFRVDFNTANIHVSGRELRKTSVYHFTHSIRRPVEMSNLR